MLSLNESQIAKVNSSYYSFHIKVMKWTPANINLSRVLSLLNILFSTPQDRISARQSELKHEMEDIERRFENMMEDLRLSRQLDELRREEFWDIQISER